MLYYGVIERFCNLLISLTSGIRNNFGVQFGGVVQAQTRVLKSNRQWFMAWAQTEVSGVRAKVHEVGKPTSHK